MHNTTRSNENEPGANPSAPDNNPSKGTRLRDLLEIDFPERVWPIKGLLPVGLTVVAGPKNSYKSTLMRALALSVSTGKDFLGTFPTEKGVVLYLALEDPKQELQLLFEKMLENRNMSMDEDPDIIIIAGEEFEAATASGPGSKIKIL